MVEVTEAGIDPSWAARATAAEAASDAKQWQRAAELWDALRADFPHQARCWLKAGEALCEARLLDDAERVLAEAVILFPDDQWTGYQHMIVARRRSDWAEALRRAENLRAAWPNFWPAWVESADALAALGHIVEAEERHRVAVERFPDVFWPNYGIARLAAQRADWVGAIRIWSELLTRFPNQSAAADALQAAVNAAERRASEAPSMSESHELMASPPMAGAAAGAAPGATILPVSDAEYRCPTELALSAAPLKRVMVIGSCLSAAWPMVLQGKHPDVIADHFLVNNAAMLPERLPGAAGEYDFHVIQIPLRQILRERMHFGLSYSDPAAFERLFETARAQLSETLAELMRWNQAHGILTFVCNFLVPQQNPMGRLLPRYDLRNFVYFIEKLNEALGQELEQYKNAYLFDYDQVVGTYGKRHLQDDAVWTISHGAALGDTGWEEDGERLEPVERISRYYPLSTHDFVLHAWADLIAMHRTIRQADQVKLVLVDLDDTMWRGIAADEADASSMAREGWPLGFAEALMFLKRRGILLGIVSKNDEDRIRGIWQRIYGDLVRLEDFAVRKINWQPKADNVEAILAEVNLLPRSVVFIDDNPVERAAIKAAFPEMRVLGPNPYLWRRILLWAPETQVATITAESAARTEMVQKQVERETQRKRLSREEFLASLEVRASLHEIASTSDGRFARVLELVNKTNQFNTTGKRWTLQECLGFFHDGGRCFGLDVTDRYTAYGIVGVLLVSGNDITQFVMSCRVVGMDVEIAAVGGVLQALAARGIAEYGATLTPTQANLLCRDLWERCGFAAVGPDRYRRGAEPFAMPTHITLRSEVLQQPTRSAAE
jgi:FkbH-like protein